MLYCLTVTGSANIYFRSKCIDFKSFFVVLGSDILNLRNEKNGDQITELVN